jgi:hypothetical protein
MRNARNIANPRLIVSQLLFGVKIRIMCGLLIASLMKHLMEDQSRF